MIKLLMKVDVRGLEYKVYLYDNQTYARLHPGSSACMVDSDREIHFNEKYHELSTIKHEVAHAFIKSCFLDYTDEICVSDFEEVVCEVIAHFDEKMIKISESIHNSIKKVIKEKNNETKETTKKRRSKKTTGR